MNFAPSLKRWLAWGTGVGIEVTGPVNAESLQITGAKVRSGGARQVAQIEVEDIVHKTAASWGAEYSKFARAHGLERIPATVVLPRRDVIVRLLNLPGVSDKDLATAVPFQIEGLHPYSESEAQVGWARIPGTSAVLVVIARRSVIDRYLTMFAEAGIPVRSLTAAPAAIYSALHLFGNSLPPAGLWFREEQSGIEIYGESSVRPVFSAFFATNLERAAALAASEMRLDSTPEVISLEQVFGASLVNAYAGALCSACPHLALPVNLLPEDQRDHSTRMAWIPATVLGCIALVLAGGLSALPRFEKREYLKSLEAEIAKVEPAANRSTTLDRQIAQTSQQIALLAQKRAQTHREMDVLAELTKILPPPTWVNLLDIGEEQVTLAGETTQAAPLLKLLDDSPFFESSEFLQAPGPSPNGGEGFRIRTKRRAVK